MKTLFTSILLSVFFSLAALLSEYSLSMMKENTKNLTEISQRLSFFYGWVKCNGESRFFVQKGYYKNDCDEDAVEEFMKKVKSELADALQDKYNKINIVKVEGAGCFDNIKALNNKKKRLLQNKVKVIRLPI